MMLTPEQEVLRSLSELLRLKINIDRELSL
jgi:hypothetical protein